MAKLRHPASTHKKVVVELSDRSTLSGYLDPSRLRGDDALDLLTPEGSHRTLARETVRAVYFVRDFDAPATPARKAFLSRPKLDGLWVRLKFRDGDTLEGVLPNDLLALLESGVQITPPDMTSPTLRIFVPHTSLSELTVLGVTGIARRKPAAPKPAQPALFPD